jgi:hypothetical protein
MPGMHFYLVATQGRAFVTAAGKSTDGGSPVRYECQQSNKRIVRFEYGAVNATTAVPESLLPGPSDTVINN